MEVQTTTQNILFENEHIVVKDYRQEPGTTLPMHNHPDYLVYGIDDGRVRFCKDDGSEEIIEIHKGELIPRKAEVHQVENIGDNELHALLIDFK